MTVNNSGTNPYTVSQDNSLIEPGGGIPNGIGGGDMAIWDQSRDNRLSALVKATFVNNSSYTLSKGVIGSTGYALANPPLTENQLTEPSNGVLYGFDFYNLIISGTVEACPALGECTDPIPITDATVTATKGDDTFTTSSGEGGTFNLSVSDTGNWEIEATRTHLSSDFETVDVQGDVSGINLNMLFYLDGGSGGLSVGRNTRFG